MYPHQDSQDHKWRSAASQLEPVAQVYSSLKDRQWRAFPTAAPLQTSSNDMRSGVRRLFGSARTGQALRVKFSHQHALFHSGPLQMPRVCRHARGAGHVLTSCAPNFDAALGPSRLATGVRKYRGTHERLMSLVHAGLLSGVHRCSISGLMPHIPCETIRQPHAA